MEGVTAAIIAKDEEGAIGRCVRSLAGADEVVVLDTGSMDRTPKVCEGLGARVVRAEPVSPFHFADARNRALAEVRTPWVVTIDADEVMRPGWDRKLRKAIADHPEMKGFLVTFIDRPPGDRGQKLKFSEPRVKVFRKGAWTWKYRVHELLVQTEPGPVGDLASAVFVEHMPDPDKPRRDRNLELLELCVRETPEHVRAFRNLGQEYMLAKRWEEAMLCLERYAEAAPDGALYTSEAMSNVGRSLAELGRLDEALSWFGRASETAPYRREPAFYAAMALIKACRLEETLEWVTRMEAVSPRMKPESPFDLPYAWTDEPARIRRFCEGELARSEGTDGPSAPRG